MNNAPLSSHKNALDSSLSDINNQPQIFLNGSPVSNLPDVQNTHFTKLQELARFNINNGNFSLALVNFDKCIEYLIEHIDGGINSPVTQDFLSTTVTYLNEVALSLLKADKPHDSLRILEKCKEYTHPDRYGNYPKLRSLTYNHIGCCFRRLGNLEKALYYLQKVLQFVQGKDRVEILGITYINLCAVLSQMNK